MLGMFNLIHLSYEVDDILHHRLQHVHCFARTCPRAADTNCQARPETHVRVERLSQKRNQSGYLYKKK